MSLRGDRRAGCEGGAQGDDVHGCGVLSGRMFCSVGVLSDEVEIDWLRDWFEALGCCLQ